MNGKNKIFDDKKIKKNTGTKKRSRYMTLMLVKY